MYCEVTNWLERLNCDDELQRREAVQELGELADESTLPRLAEALGDPSAAVREAAVDALQRFPAEPVVPQVLPLLRSENTAQRNAAALVLEAAGEAAVDPLGKLAVQDEDEDVRKFAVDILARIGGARAVTYLVQALSDVNVNVAAAAAEALGMAGTEECVGSLVRALKAHSFLRCTIARSLGQLGGPDSLQALCQLLEDEDPAVVFTAVQALAEVGDETVLEPLLQLLGRAPAPLLSSAVNTLERIVRRLNPAVLDKIRPALPVHRLLALTEHKDKNTRRSAVALMAHFGSPEVLPTLVQVLVSPANYQDAQIRRSAIEAIAACHPADAQALSLHAHDSRLPVEVREDVITAVGKIGTPDAAITLLALLTAPEPQLRAKACEQLALCDGEQTEPALCKVLRDPEPSVRAAAAKALGQIGRLLQGFEDPCAEQELAERLKSDEDATVRLEAARALAETGTSKAVNVLLEVARSGPDRLAALRAFMYIQKFEQVKEAVVEAAGDKDSAVSLAALEVLTARQVAPETCPETVEHALKAEDKLLRVAAVRWLRLAETDQWHQQLLELFERDPDLRVRYEAVRTLGALKAEQARDSILQYLNRSEGTDPLVTLGCLETLVEIGDETCLDTLERFLSDPDTEISEAAARALIEISY